MKLYKATFFAPGARVVVDNVCLAVVRGAFPEGSTSYLFPHYKVDILGGDANVAVAMERVRGEVRS